MISKIRFPASTPRGSAAKIAAPLAIVLSLTLATSGAAAPDTVVNDANIRTAVEDEILFDSAVPLDEVDVTSADGVVTLTGTVDNILAKERATRIATTVKGGPCPERGDFRPVGRPAAPPPRSAKETGGTSIGLPSLGGGATRPTSPSQSLAR